MYEAKDSIDEVCWGSVECENHYDKFLTQPNRNQALIRPMFYSENIASAENENSKDFIFTFYEPDLSNNPTILNTINSQEPKDEIDVSASERNSDVEKISTESSKETNQSSTKTCPAGKYLNPLTNRCRKVQISTASKVNTIKATNNTKTCPAGKYLNPTTNRCNNTTTAKENSSAIAKPCKAGYERNPATNRCRKTATTTNQLKPCKDGYERNPTTNRCRKIRATSTANVKYPVENSQGQDTRPANLAAFSTFGAATIAATAYTGYQFRHRIKKIIANLLAGRQ